MHASRLIEIHERIGAVDQQKVDPVCPEQP